MDHWSKVARTWSLLGPPLRPSPEDIAFVRSALATLGTAAPISSLVLGVTPELVTLELPPGSTVTAIDRHSAMIELLFKPTANHRALVGDWRRMELSSESIDAALGDGCTTLFAFPNEHRAFVAELARVVRPGGLVVLRLFASPETPETLDEVRAALPSVTGFHALKWRIAMAIQDSKRAVRVAAIRDAFDALVPDRASFAQSTGISREVIDNIDTYAGSTAVYSFPTVKEVRALFASEFTELACHVPPYELGDRCPTMVLRRAPE